MVMDQLTVIKTIDSRRRRLNIRRLKYTCESNPKTHVVEKRKSMEGSVGEANLSNCSTEISLSLTSSSEENGSAENEVVLAGYGKDDSEKPDAPGGFTRICYGSVSVIGRRKEMEDAVRVELGFTTRGDDNYDFFGVYDGHGGARVADACRERLHRVLEEEMAEGKGIDWENVMETCFRKMDEEVVKDKMMGSTAVVAVVGKDEVVVANCGDSRAVICRAGVAVPLSVDHKPERPDELERVEAAGGRIINWNGHRVLGVLATSRSIGDQYLKPFVISKPEVTVCNRAENDEFLILASDGLWDVVSNEVACQIGRRCLSGKMRRKSQQQVVSEARAAEAAAVLVELAIARGSKDNISVIVVELNKFAKKTSPNRCQVTH
ncbi:protein phosphatase 2C 51-like [Euphorbia lathyris]|uniref:protein phosphatase 2C 51-like n=1 Tax=Euphorbia lathyris TaxID=212925 RepID=UPI003313D14B